MVFELPPYYAEGLNKVTVVFNQEERLIMLKAPKSIEVDEHHMYVECVLSSTETLEFGHTYIDTLVQLKLEYWDKTLYTDVERLKVVPTLDTDGPSPDVPVMIGIGYTED